jgi:hypothetical protein
MSESLAFCSCNTASLSEASTTPGLPETLLDSRWTITSFDSIASFSDDDISPVSHRSSDFAMGLTSGDHHGDIAESFLPGTPEDTDYAKECYQIPAQVAARNHFGMEFETPDVEKPLRQIPDKSPNRMLSRAPCAPQKFGQPEETCIFFDWDDTLCPTTSYLDVLKGRSAFIDARNPALLAHEEAVVALLEDAVKLGGVTIITMAQLTWIETCIEKLMPKVGMVLKQHGIEVVSARASNKKKLAREAFGDCRDPSQYLKKKAMLRVVKQFYKSRGYLQGFLRNQRSWKNVISIGDSDAERLALQDVIFNHKQYENKGHMKPCHCKTVSLLSEPDLEELTIEANNLRKLLPALVLHDGDADLDMSEPCADAFELICTCPHELTAKPDRIFLSW